jgi:hypothetical protein
VGDGDDSGFLSSFEAVLTGQLCLTILHATTYFVQPRVSSSLAQLLLQLCDFLLEGPDIGQRRRFVVMAFILVCNARCTPRLATIAFGLCIAFSFSGNHSLLGKPTFLRRQPAHVDLRCLLRGTSFGFDSVSSCMLPVRTSSCCRFTRRTVLGSGTYHPRRRGCAAVTTQSR